MIDFSVYKQAFSKNVKAPPTHVLTSFQIWMSRSTENIKCNPTTGHKKKVWSKEKKKKVSCTIGNSDQTDANRSRTGAR